MKNETAKNTSDRMPECTKHAIKSVKTKSEKMEVSRCRCRCHRRRWFIPYEGPLIMRGHRVVVMADASNPVGWISQKHASEP